MIVYAVIYMGEVLHWYVDASRAEFWRREGYQVIEFSLGLRQTGPFQKPAEPLDAGSLGSGHSPSVGTVNAREDSGGSVEEPSTHLIHGPASTHKPEGQGA
tara:strand:- start:793 stop:1095 length:303 start_codon:yes stop_codon:yes gene_type:complete